MQQVIEIGDKKITVTCNAFMPILYKRQFGRDFFADMMKMDGVEQDDYSKLDIETMFDMAWCMARLADKSILPPDEWLESLAEFPIDIIMKACTDMLLKTFKPSKNSAAVQRESL